jgi:hypothetical protein
VVSAAGPIYGRPSDQLCIRVEERELRQPASQIATRLPLRAGVLVRPGALAEALVADLARRARSPLAAQVSSLAEAQRAVTGGANALVVSDAGLARSLRDAADPSGGRASRVTVVGCAADGNAAGEMIAAGVDALLVPAAELPRLSWPCRCSGP